MPRQGPPRAAKAVPSEDKRFPNLAAEREWDREQHIRRAMASGLTRRQAERHADEELAEWGV
jgi:hypothetical protein